MTVCANLGSAADHQSSCKRCRVGSSVVIIICEAPVPNATIKLNCSGGGLFSVGKCYEWRGDLKNGENPIPLTRFTTEEGKKFNPIEYEVRTLRVMNPRLTDYSFFDFTK